MKTEDLVFVGTSDLAGHFRGKAVPAVDLAERMRKGVGLTGSNIMLSAFGPIYESPFGTEGDLVLLPDPTTHVHVPFDGSSPEHFYLGDIKTTDGRAWSCCPRDFARRGILALEREAGLRLLASFEQEFVHCGIDACPGTAYGHDAFRHQGAFGGALFAAMRTAGVTPDSFLPEYGAAQFEVTATPYMGRCEGRRPG